MQTLIQINIELEHWDPTNFPSSLFDIPHIRQNSSDVLFCPNNIIVDMRLAYSALAFLYIRDSLDSSSSSSNLSMASSYMTEVPFNTFSRLLIHPLVASRLAATFFKAKYA